MVECSSCGCCWDAENGYYYCKGKLQQPCKECRKDAKSVRYLNNRDRILEAQRTAYYANHEVSKIYFREYRRNQGTPAAV
jgi:hypothetical protein